MQVCRICLTIEGKMYKINDYNLHTYLEDISETSMLMENYLPQTLCWECTQRLINCVKFKRKMMKAQQLLIGLSTKNYLSQEIISSIDRQSNKLKSSLTHKIFPSNYSDLHLHDTSISFIINNDVKSNDNSELYVDLEFKNEVNFDNVENSKVTENIFDNYEEIHEIYNAADDTVKTNYIVLTECETKTKKRNTNNMKQHKNKIQKPKTAKLGRPKKSADELLNDEIFTITKLTNDEQIMEIQKRKDSVNYTKSEYKCKKCYKGFLDEDTYMCHMKRHSEQCGVYECHICKVRFKKQHSHTKHISSHVEKFSCKRCPYVTYRRHAAKLHEEYHNGTRYQCPHCQEDFGKFSTYMSHVRLKHPSDIVCALCGYSFVSAKGLTLHKRLKHRFEKDEIPDDGPTCEQCDVRFASREALQRHVKLSARHKNLLESKETSQNKTHPAERSRKTPNCIRKKNKTNKPEGPISCEQCDMQLPDPVSYYHHFRRQHPDKNRTNYPSVRNMSMCEVCGKMFHSLALLQDHSFTHSDTKQFNCAQCGKSFQRKYRLIAHHRLHTSQRATHTCSVCGKHFTTASNMQRHMVSHTGLKPYKCEMCAKCFKHASEKRVHITYVHLKKPWPKRARGKRRDGKQPQPQQSPPSADLDNVLPLWPAALPK